jgi:hypothetical protein
MQHLIDLICQHFNQELTESISLIPNGILITTMEEAPAIILALHKTSSQFDIDIMEFSMHSKMIQDEDNNFITTLTFIFHDIRN